MSIEITMPALSPTMEEGTLAKWLVKEGDTVEPGDVIAEIETDKATMEVEAVDEGTVAKIVVPAGSEAVKVNAVIAILSGDDDDGTVGVSEAEVPTATSDPDTAPEPKVVEEAAHATTDHGKPAVTGTPVQPRAAADTAKSDAGRLFATPLARRIAADAGIDLARITGSGPRGRIVKADVEAAANGDAASSMKPEETPVAGQGTAAEAATARPVANGPSDEQVLALYDESSYSKRPHDGMRRTIAERLTQSAQTIPSYFITVDCELDALLALRKDMNAGAPKDGEGEPLWRLSVNDFLVKAMAVALRDVPDANVSWTSTDRIFHEHADVGVAVAVEDGLFTPIVRRADEKTLSTIAREIKDLAGRARTKKLKPQEYQGGSTAVSNLGMFGVKEFTSIINPPHASIVSIGAGVKRPVVRGGAIEVATVMTATFAFDHRAIDGALGARLAAAFKRYVEHPMAMLA